MCPMEIENAKKKRSMGRYYQGTSFVASILKLGTWTKETPS